MQVNTVGHNKIEIILNNNEISDIFGGYEQIDYNLPECRAKIHYLFSITVPDILFPLDCKQVYIEVKPKKSGCIISFTKLYCETKRYKRVTEREYITMIFANCENMISSLKALNSLIFQTSELYTNGKKYAVIAAVKHLSAKDLLHISEYCDIYKDKNTAWRIREYWDAVCKKGAIQRLNNAFLK